MKRLGAQAIGAVFWLGVGLFFAAGAVKLGPGSARNPGPGFLPLIMALLLVSFSAWTLVKGLAVQGKSVGRIDFRKQLTVVAVVCAYGALLDLGGFLLSTCLLMFVLYALLFTGESRWAKALAYGVGTALIGWLVFAVALKVPFPQARLW